MFKPERGEVLTIAPHVVYPYDNVASPDTGEIYLLQGIVDIFTQTREKLGVPIIINAGYRTMAYQAELRRRGLKASRISPHEHGAALDLSIQFIRGESLEKRCLYLISWLCDAGKNLGTRPYMRFGYKEYGCTFVHVDVAPMLFDPNWKALALDKLDPYLDKFCPYGTDNPCPDNWKAGITW